MLKSNFDLPLDIFPFSLEEARAIVIMDRMVGMDGMVVAIGVGIIVR